MRAVRCLSACTVFRGSPVPAGIETRSWHGCVRAAIGRTIGVFPRRNAY